jgi:hypothetical protein
MYSDEETIVSRNYLLFLEDKFNSKTEDEYLLNEAATSNTTFGNASNSSSNSGSSANSSNTKFKPADKLIIKAKVYILEILEVKKNNPK